MKRTYEFAKPSGRVTCELESGERLSLPVFQGVLKHPDAQGLTALLSDPRVARKYTIKALEKMGWPVLKTFPRYWLKARLPDATMRESRRKALEFLLE